ncbi:hypothetical protein GGR51DRAFT_505447 [Nemania sp. FL0031]|nr:hypothetical protein GGR51DRAFT_505447 [Nemania sp. FL0031]
MHITKALFLFAFAGPALSQKSDAEYCSWKVSSFFSWVRAEGPTTPAAVLSYIATAPGSQPPLATFGPSEHGDEICSIYNKLPPSLIPEFITYITSVRSFGSANSDNLISVATECEPEDKIASVINYIHGMVTPTADSCQYTPHPGGVASGIYPTSPIPTPTSSYNSTGNYTYPTSVFTAAATKPTGVLLGAAAIGGILGAAIML